MALIKLQFKPGVNRDNTNYGNEGGWWACDHIRFRSGQPEKIGGWVKASPDNFIGTCRQMWNWVTTFTDNLLALGTDKKVYIEEGGNFHDITPLRATTPTLIAPVTSNSISTLLGSNIVTVTLTSAHGAGAGQYVVISGVAPPDPGTIGGIPTTQINGNHKILDLPVPTATAFSFAVPTVATSTVAAAGGAAIVISFEIEPGYASTTAGYGWGAGVWGGHSPPPPSPIPPGYGRAWGTGTTEPVFQQQRDWWFDNFDNDLVMNIRNGPAYWWERGTIQNADIALKTKAIRLVDYSFNQATAFLTAGGTLPYTADDYRNAVPAKIMQVVVSQQDKHLLAFGAVPLLGNDDGTVIVPSDPAKFDPMLIRWADQDTPWDWIPDVTNTAGDIRLSRGSRIVRALPTRQEILVWTDSNLYALQFLGSSDVFGVQEYADNISIISPRACISASNVTYWMGKDQFYMYTGRVETMQCTLRQHVFQNINTAERAQIVCGTNEEWHEVWWFYPSTNSLYNDSYVVYNHLEQVWYYGSIGRTAWLDTPLHDWPVACQTPGGTDVGTLYFHENGVDADGLPLPAFIQSSDFDLDEGDKYMLIKRLIPDVSFRDSVVQEDWPLPEVTVQMRPRNFPGAAPFPEASDTQRVIAQATVGLYTEQVFIRARARQMAFKIMSENLGTQWQLGSPRLDAKPDGMR